MPYHLQKFLLVVIVVFLFIFVDVRLHVEVAKQYYQGDEIHPIHIELIPTVGATPSSQGIGNVNQNCHELCLFKERKKTKN